MKRLYTILFIFFTAIPLFAQTENRDGNLPDFDSPRYKDFNGFILDMGPMMDMPAYLAPPSLSFRPFGMMSPEPYQLNPEALRINPNVTYLGTSPAGFSPYTFYSLLYPSASYSP